MDRTIDSSKNFMHFSELYVRVAAALSLLYPRNSPDMAKQRLRGKLVENKNNLIANNKIISKK